MNRSANRIEEIIGAKTEDRNEEFGTPRGFEFELTAEGELAGREKGSATGERTAKTRLRQLNLEESFRLKEARAGKRKERSPEEEEKKKREKKEEGKREKEEKGESKEVDSKEDKESKEETEKEEEDMEKMQKTLDQMMQMMREERKERNQMMADWEKKWEKKWQEMEAKIEEELKSLKKQLEEERKERVSMGESLRREAEKESEKREELKKKLESKAKDIEEKIKEGPTTAGREEVEKDFIEKERDLRQMKELEWRIEEGERERKRNNVVMIGLEEGDWNKQKLEEWIEENLEVEVELKRVWRIRGKNKEKIGAECRDREEKERIMEAKKKLKGSKIYIDHDTTWKERRTRDRMIETAKNWRKEGYVVKVGRNKLMVDDKEYRWSEKEEKFFRRDRK